MFWRVICEEGSDASEPDRSDGRFVVHQHRDADGPHLDLRLEHGEYLVGWRVDGDTLEGEPWATVKSPHPASWLDQDGDAVRMDAGVFTWVERGADRRVLLLHGRTGTRRVRLERAMGLPAAAARAVCEALTACGADMREAGRLIQDGATARARAIERLCGLGRELDGSAFDAPVWRKLLADLSLEEIHAQLRAYEVRFDAKYPPGPVSRPERLPEGECSDGAGVARSDVAMAIVRG